MQIHNRRRYDERVPPPILLVGSTHSDLLAAGATANAQIMLKLIKGTDALDHVRLGSNNLDEHFLRAMKPELAYNSPVIS